MPEVVKTYHIPDRNIDRLDEQLAKLNKRAKKLGVEPIGLVRRGFTDTPHACPDDNRGCPRRGTVTRVWEVEVFGTTPKLAGWTFVATIEHTPDGNIIRAVPGKELPVEYRSADRVCDHCQTRRHRRDTYVVSSGEGDTLTYKQVGSNCIADFLGSQDAQALASWAEALAAFALGAQDAEDEDWGGGGGGREYIRSEEYLWHVAAMLRTHGWLSRTKARENAQYHDGQPTWATADRALDNMFPDPKARAKGEVVDIEEVDKDRATAALAWAENVLHEMPDEELNDYLHNLRALTKASVAESKHLGLLASLIPTAEREGEKAERIARDRAERSVREYVGEVGKRAVFTLTVQRTREVEGVYGLTTIINFRDPDGNVVVWFKSGSIQRYVVIHDEPKPECCDLRVHTDFEPDFVEGETYEVKATVKAQEDSEKWGRQTIITRAVIVRKHEQEVPV